MGRFGVRTKLNRILLCALPHMSGVRRAWVTTQQCRIIRHTRKYIEARNIFALSLSAFINASQLPRQYRAYESAMHIIYGADAVIARAAVTRNGRLECELHCGQSLDAPNREGGLLHSVCMCV